MQEHERRRAGHRLRRLDDAVIEGHRGGHQASAQPGSGVEQARRPPESEHGQQDPGGRTPKKTRAVFTAVFTQSMNTAQTRMGAEIHISGAGCAGRAAAAAQGGADCRAVPTYCSPVDTCKTAPPCTSRVLNLVCTHSTLRGTYYTSRSLNPVHRLRHQPFHASALSPRLDRLVPRARVQHAAVGRPRSQA